MPKWTWNLYLTLLELDVAAARRLFDLALRWMIEVEPAALGADQAQIRQYVLEELRKDPGV